MLIRSRVGSRYMFYSLFPGSLQLVVSFLAGSRDTGSWVSHQIVRGEALRVGLVDSYCVSVPSSACSFDYA